MSEPKPQPSLEMLSQQLAPEKETTKQLCANIANQALAIERFQTEVNQLRELMGFIRADLEGTGIWRLQQRCALLDSLLGECIRHHYYDDTKVSQTWLVEAHKAITPLTTTSPK